MFKTIKNRLIAIMTAIVVLALFASTAATYFTVRNRTLEQVSADLTALSRANAANMSAWVHAQMDLVASLVPATQSGAAAPFLVQAMKSGRLAMAYIGYADKHANFPDPALDAKLPPGFDITQRPWYQLANGKTAPVITPPYADTTSKKLVVTFAQAVKSGNDTQAVVGTDVSLDDVVKIVQTLKPTPHGFAFLLGKDGQVIAHPDQVLWLKPVAEISKDIDANLLSLARNADAAMPTVSIKGDNYLLRAVPVEGTDWTLVSAAQRDEALAPVNALLKAAALVLVIALAVSAVAITTAVRAIFASLNRVRDAMNDIGSGSGDLSKRLPVTGSDEISQIAASFNQFAGKIASVVREMRGVSDSIATASSEIATGNLDLSQRTEQTASSLQVTTNSMEQFTNSIRQSSDAAHTASELAGTAAAVASRGGQAMSQVVSTMEEINESSKKIADITGTIDGIAFQTNILALNAAVEAARAGEQGRGFAVVASEVRSLAQRSAQAAKEIKELIGTSVAKVGSGTLQVQSAGSTMQEIVESVERVTNIISEISAATAEQSEGVSEVNASIATVEQMTQQNAALVEESAAAAASMKEQAQRLAQVVSTFRLGDDHGHSVRALISAKG